MKRTVHFMLTIELASVCALSAVFGASSAIAISMVGRPAGALFALAGAVSLLVTISVIGCSDQEKKNVSN